MLTIYNSLSQQKEAFIPLRGKEIRMYVCGVTVYDYCHLGHARTYTAFDVIIRFLRERGYEVNYVRNITDIDDKIINRANDRGLSFQSVVDEFTQAMHDDFAALGLIRPDHEPRATEYVPSIVDMILALIEKGAAYVASNGDVYYEVRKFADYGCLAHRDIDKLESGARVEINDVKRDPLDFVLWKLAKPGEPKWPSPWGDGRPGWHSECSVMSNALLGDSFDIHGGGKDLIFPHHENEIAQSEVVHQKPFVKTWMHSGFLQIDKEKMSKSLGNFFTIREALAKFKPEVLRYFFSSSHYRSSLQFSESALEHAKLGLGRLYTALKDAPPQGAIPKATTFEARFIEAMEDDFNTPIAYSVLFDLAHEIQRLRENDLTLATSFSALLQHLGSTFGILQIDPQVFLQSSAPSQHLDPAQIESLIAARNAARANKQWQEADRIRDQLADLAVVIEDGPNGTTWKTQ